MFLMYVTCIVDMDYYVEHKKICGMLDRLKLESSIKAESLHSWLKDYEDFLATTNCSWIKSHLNASK